MELIDFYCPDCGRKTSIKEELEPIGKKSKR